MPPVFVFKSMLMRDVFAALLRYSFAIPSEATCDPKTWELYGSDMDGERPHGA